MRSPVAIVINPLLLALASRVEQGRFALHVASKALEYYAETVFKVPYPLKKSDLLAIPGAKGQVGMPAAEVDCLAMLSSRLVAVVMLVLVVILVVSFDFMMLWYFSDRRG